MKFYSTDYILQTKFEAIIKNDVGGDRFQVKIYASQQIQDSGHYNFLPVAPMVIILVFLEGQCREHWKKRLISIICKYPGKIMEFSKFHLNSK